MREKIEDDLFRYEDKIPEQPRYHYSREERKRLYPPRANTRGIGWSRWLRRLVYLNVFILIVMTYLFIPYFRESLSKTVIEGILFSVDGYRTDAGAAAVLSVKNRRDAASDASGGGIFSATFLFNGESSDFVDTAPNPGGERTLRALFSGGTGEETGKVTVEIEYRDMKKTLQAAVSESR